MKTRLSAYISRETYDYMKRISAEQRMTLGEVTENGINALQALKKIADLLTDEQKEEFIKKMINE